jgi:hypothetical protein
VKANLARLGIRGFRPNLDQTASYYTPEGVTIPGNTLAELRRDMDILRFVKQQIKEMRRPAPSAWLRHPASNATLWCGTRAAGGA